MEKVNFIDASYSVQQETSIQNDESIEPLATDIHQRCVLPQQTGYYSDFASRPFRPSLSKQQIGISHQASRSLLSSLPIHPC